MKLNWPRIHLHLKEFPGENHVDVGVDAVAAAVVVATGNFFAAVAAPHVCPDPVAADAVIAAVIGYVMWVLRSWTLAFGWNKKKREKFLSV